MHQARKAARRARYASEAMAPAIGPEAGRFAKQMKKVQSVLGEHQDSVVAADRLRALAAAAPAEQAVAAGRLVEREKERRAAARAAWREVWKALRKTV